MCIHIFLPRLPLHYLQEPLPLSSIQHPLCDEPNRGVILNGREVRGFLNSGMSEIYKVKRKPFHMVEHLSAAIPNLGCGSTMNLLGIRCQKLFKQLHLKTIRSTSVRSMGLLWRAPTSKHAFRQPKLSLKGSCQMMLDQDACPSSQQMKPKSQDA